MRCTFFSFWPVLGQTDVLFINYLFYNIILWSLPLIVFLNERLIRSSQKFGVSGFMNLNLNEEHKAFRFSRHPFRALTVLSQSKTVNQPA